METTIRLLALHHTTGRPGRSLTELVTILGSGTGADLILPSNEADAAHAAVVRLGRAAYLCDLGAPGGTSLNGRRIRWARLADGDGIALGSFRFRVELREASGGLVTAEEPAFSLRCDHAFGVMTSIDPVLIVGSDPGCDVVLKHRAVAPRHCMVVWTEEGPIVRDLQGRQAILLNGHRTHFGRLLSGDAIGVGPFELVFEAIVSPENAGLDSQWPPGASAHGSLETEPSMLVAGRLVEDHVPRLGELWPESATRIADCGLEPFSRRACPARRSVQFSRDPQGSAPGDCGRQMAPGKRAAVSEIDEKGRALDDRFAHLRARVTAAQEALDERARKYQGRLNTERLRLKAYRDALQERAEKLLKPPREARGQTEPQASARGQHVGPVAHAPGSDRDRPRNAAAGGPCPAGDRSDIDAQPFQPDETYDRDDALAVPADLDAGQGVCASGPSGLDRSAEPGEAVNLQESVRQIADLVQAGRQQIDHTERRLESLHLDIRGLRGAVARSGRRHKARDLQLQDRFGRLEKAQRALFRERDELTTRIRRLNDEETTLSDWINEAEGDRLGFERETEQLAASEAELYERQHEPKNGLEQERRRIQAHQARLQPKTVELTQVTRRKRCTIEAQVAQKRAELNIRQDAIKVGKPAVEDADPEALHQTGMRLEEILSIGLDEIETELKATQADLSVRARALLDEDALDGSLEMSDRQRQPFDLPVAQLDEKTASLRGAEREPEQCVPPDDLEPVSKVDGPDTDSDDEDRLEDS